MGWSMPGNNESVGKWNTYISVWYWRSKQKKGDKKVIAALARKFLVIIYTMLKQSTLSDEACFEPEKTVSKSSFPVIYEN